jgi:hypothetical protein
MALPHDYRDLLAAFDAHDVRYLVVGGYAVGFHGRPRFTKDLDVWVEPTSENLGRVKAALVEFGAPSEMIAHLELARPEDVLWMGVPPLRIDVVKGVPGGNFERAFATRATADWDGVPVSLVGRAELIRLKRASGRPQDLVDAASLEELEE